MSVHQLFAAADTALLGAAGRTAAARVSGFEIGSGRTVPTVAAVIGLAGVVIGVLALARSAGRTSTGNRRASAVTALALGLISLIVGGLHAANSAGGFGTGNGLAGAIAALVLGLIGVAVAALALARSRRAG